jgi:hypothetical protein
MPAIKEKKGHISFSDHTVGYMKADEEFIEGINKGVQACCEGRARPWADIKRELGLS